MKGKFIKKLTACAMVAALAVTTPLSAFASGFSDNFWVSDGNPENDQEASGTGTVTSTNTNTEGLQYADQIAGIVVVVKDDTKSSYSYNDRKTTLSIIKDKESSDQTASDNAAGQNYVNLIAYAYSESGGGKTLITDGTITTAINKHFEWSSSDLTKIRPKSIYSNGRQNCTLTAYKGGIAYLTASLDLNDDGAADYSTVIKVTVTKKATAVELVLPDQTNDGGYLYANHTYDLMDYVQFTPSDAYETLQFGIEETPETPAQPGKYENGLITADQKLISFATDGTVSVNKSLTRAKVKSETGYTIYVSTTRGSGEVTNDTGTKVTFHEGNPVKTMKTSDSAKKTYDIADNYTYDKTSKSWSKNSTDETHKLEAKVTITAKLNDSSIKKGNTTDDITWTTSDSSIVTIETGNSDYVLNAKTDTLTDEKYAEDVLNKVKFVGKSVGKATVTATATSGKTAKWNVTVTATLLKIESAQVDDSNDEKATDVTYTGKTTPLAITRIPAENQDKLKIAVKVKGTKLKNLKTKAAITPILTPGVDVSKITVGSSTGSTESGLSVKKDTLIVTTSKTYKQGKVPENVTVDDDYTCSIDAFKIEQSDVKIESVYYIIGYEEGKATPSEDMDKAKLTPNTGYSAKYYVALDTDNDRTNTPGAEAVSWTSSKETVATVSNGLVNVVGTGSAKITVSSVYKDGTKYKTQKKTFSIKSTPKCEDIVLKASLVTVKGGKAATVNVKQQLPKKAADGVVWRIYNSAGTCLYSSDGAVTTDSSISLAKKMPTDKKISWTTENNTAVYTVEAIAGTMTTPAVAKVLVIKSGN